MHVTCKACAAGFGNSLKRQSQLGKGDGNLSEIATKQLKKNIWRIKVVYLLFNYHQNEIVGMELNCETTFNTGWLPLNGFRWNHFNWYHIKQYTKGQQQSS